MNKHTSVENKCRARTTKASSFNDLPKRIQREEMKAIADRNNVTTGDVQESTNRSHNIHCKRDAKKPCYVWISTTYLKINQTME